METIGKVEALKTFFGTTRPVTNDELIDFRREDKAGFDELAALAAAALGKSLIQR